MMCAVEKRKSRVGKVVRVGLIEKVRFERT